MKGDPVPDTDHIARYCGGASVNEDGSVSGVAFRLRRGGDGGREESLSVNWLENLDQSDRFVQIAALRQTLGAKLKLGARARLAVLNVGQVRQHVKSASTDQRDLEVRHDPTPGDPSHSGVFNVYPDDDLIADLIAETVPEVYPARGP